MIDDNNDEKSGSVGIFPAGYLDAKKHIDDVSLNGHVLRNLKRILQPGRPGDPLQILEIGGGIGTMLARLVERQFFTGSVMYRLTDNDVSHLDTARSYLRDWSEKHNITLSWPEERCGRLHTSTAELTVILEELDIRKIDEHLSLCGTCDLVLAHGVLDLFDFSQVMPAVFRCLKSLGFVYFTCNFDGETIFLPEHPADEQIVRHYHQSMERRLHGASHTGRRLLGYLHNQQKEIMAAGSSDWIIHPGEHGYSDAQKLFLLAIIDMIALELAGKVEMVPEIDGWLRRRRQQVEDGSLFFLAKHLDVLARHRSL